MLADRLRAIREAKSWSQGHLADAAGLNVRTIQRIEAGDTASHETLLSLAAALDINVSELEPTVRGKKGIDGLSRWRATLGTVVLTPAIMFIAVNLLRSVAGISGPFDWMSEEGGKLISFRTFNLISPVVFVGGAAAALVVCLPAVARLRTARVCPESISINAIELRSQPVALVIVAAAILSSGTLLAYAALEFLRTPAS